MVSNAYGAESQSRRVVPSLSVLVRSKAPMRRRMKENAATEVEDTIA